MKQSKKILIAIKDEFLRRIYCDFFNEEGFSVFELLNGEKEAMRIVEEESPDIILIDIFIAEKNNFDFLQKIKENEKTKKIPILMFSAIEEDKYRKKAIEFEVKDFIVGSYSSPFNILAKVKIHLGFEKSYEIKVDIENEKIKELAADLGYNSLLCSKCGNPMKLFLIRDLSKGRRYFQVSFTCFCSSNNNE